MKIGSLFSGCGGLDMAAVNLFPGAAPAWHCDVKPAAVALLAHRFPGVPNLGDITTVDWSHVQPVDVLTFGWPCQPWSPAGKQLGDKDHRALFPEVVRCVAALRPRVLLGENVARVTSSGELRRVVRSLADLGYVGAWRCVTAAETGAPHERGRVALVATRGSVDEIPPFLSSKNWALPVPAVPRLIPTPRESDAGPRGGTTGRGLRNWFREIAQSDGWGVYEPAIRRWETTLGRTAPAPTQLGPRGGFQGSDAFVEWMMGLPEGWVSRCPALELPGNAAHYARVSLLGDGVVPQQMAHGFRLCLDSLAGDVAA